MHKKTCRSGSGTFQYAAQAARFGFGGGGRACAHRSLTVAALFGLLTVFLSAATVRGQDAGSQKWVTETLDNGLRVIYAPMPTSPVTHVRVLYHVGSRDEQADRQGFAHMFEHMMFRGSAHVAPQEHMKLVGLVGGYCNAFTSFDETVYHDTLPSTYNELALWLEADRMASFKVSQQIFVTERQVVGEEWRMRLNQPYGGMFDQLLPAVFKVHPYHWTPIGNMEQLGAAKVEELQAFFNRYYGPNNAILVIAGNIDVEKTKGEVKKYFGWIPARGETNPAVPAQAGNGAAAGAAGSDVHLTVASTSQLIRHIPVEPSQTEPRRLEVKMTAPLARVLLAYRMPREDSDDLDALGLLLSVLGDGQSSRLFRSLVTTDDPLCVDAGELAETLEDGGVMGVEATVLNGKSPAEVEKIMRAQIAEIREKPVTAEEIEKAKQQERLSLAQRFETAEKVASALGQEMLVRNNLDRIPTARARLEALTPADLQRVAQKYLQDNGVTTMVITPGTPQEAAAAAAAAQAAPPGANATPAGSAPAAAAIKFPADYPTAPPLSGKLPAATFEKGTEMSVDLPGAAAPVRVIVMEDHRMPIVNWSLALRAGGHSEATGKEGLANLTAEMVRRGPKGKTFDQFNEDLESRAISLDVSDGGDTTRISGSCLKEQFQYAFNATKEMMLTPAFDEGEFSRLKNQSLSSLRLSLNNAQTLASRQLTKAIYGDSPLGRLTTMGSLSGSTLDDVRKFFNTTYRVDGAILMISGDISVSDGQVAAKNFLTGLSTGNLPKVDYMLPTAANQRRIILVDRPESKQAAIRMGVRAYSIRSDEKFAGTLANQMLSGGIESRLGLYVRAEKGYVYGVQAIFSPNRNAGAFVGQTDTKFETTADTITAMYKVFDDMKAKVVPAAELADAKFRVSGQLLMAMETTADQASRRVEGILNGYPIDYYDKYAERVGMVTAEQVKDAMDKYVLEDQMTVVVVGPADVLKAQLEKIGTVQVVPANAQQ